MNLALVFKSTCLWPLYLGVLDIFHQQELPFHSIFGSGSGAWISALYAYCLDPKWMIHFCETKIESGSAQYLSFEDYPLAFSPKRLKLPFTSPTTYQPHDLEDLLPPILHNKMVEEAFLDLGIFALDIRKGVVETFTNGALMEVLLGSMAYPGYFQYCSTPYGPLVDPFLVEPISISPIKELGGDMIFAVYPHYVLPPLDHEEISTQELISRILLQRMARFSDQELEKADLVLSFPYTTVKKMDISYFKELVQKGRSLGESYLAQIYQLLEEKEDPFL